MKIKGFQISNYKCFDEGNWTPLSEGIAVLTGRNSAGKTALLEALSLTLRANPHRSLKRKTPERSPSVVQLRCEVSKAELAKLADQGQRFHLPVPLANDPLIEGVLGRVPYPTTRYLTTEQRNDFGAWVFEHEMFEVKVTRAVSADGGITDRSSLVILENIRQAQREDGSRDYLPCTFINGEYRPLGAHWSASQVDWFPGLTAQVASRVYRFSPERFSAGASPYGDNPVLLTNAGNLPEVLNALQPYPRFRGFNHLVSRVLPQVKWVDIRPRNPNNEIWIWPEDRETGRDDLAIPLADCGTGVGHVLAILYVLFTATSEQTILIDEPQSFLHPGAARRLMNVLSEFPQHQLVIATHSPAVISAGAVQQVLSISTDGQAMITAVPWEDTTHRAALLNELGARLADVYGADDILWVEGPTEEECFPKILSRLAPGALSGTAILAVRKTGDLEGKDAERVFEIYGSLSSSGSLLPPTIAFLFDRECWSTQKVKELKARSKGLLRTTNRRTFENFLLHADGIACVINNADQSRSTQVTRETIEEFLQNAVADPKYGCKHKPEGADESHFFDAPEALKNLFNELTEARVSYLKTTHSVALCDWILDNDPEFLRPVAVILENALSARLLEARKS